jgi:hypothetical protein
MTGVADCSPDCTLGGATLASLMRVVPPSKPIPATIGTAFGGLWALLAAMALPSDLRFPVAIIAAFVTARLIARLWQLSHTSAAPRARLFDRKPYQFAVVAEIITIYAASAVLPRLGWQDYFIQIVGIIVGLHFIGLWAATRSKRFLGVAGGMCVISAIAIPLPASLHHINIRDVFTGLGNGLVLWVGASRSS